MSSIEYSLSVDLDRDFDEVVSAPRAALADRTGGTTRVSAVAAEQMLGMVGNAELAPIAAEVAGRLDRVLAAVAAA